MTNATLYPTASLSEAAERWAAVVSASGLFLILHWHYDIVVFYYDAGFYWNLASPPIFFNYPEVIRGYLYPAILLPFRYLGEITGSALWPFRLASSIVYGWLLAGVLPDFFGKHLRGRVDLVRRLVPAILLASLMPGVLLYPLSDLAALAMAFGSLVCISHSFRAQGFRRFAFTVAAGFLAYGAYNTRTIYAFAAVAIFAVLFTQTGRRSRIAAFVVGFTLAGLPQSLINVHRHDRWLPVVVVDVGQKKIGEKRPSLSAVQTLWGMEIQRYETNVNPSAAPSAGLYYMDPAGKRLLDEHVSDFKKFSVAEYLGIMLRNPFDFVGMLGRHFVNGLDVRDGEVYTQSLSSSRNGVSFINFCVVFVGFAIWARSASRASKRDVTAFGTWAMPLLLPVLAILPGAIETRFFLPLHMMLYAGIAFLPTRSDITSLIKRHWALTLISFLAAASIFYAITTSTMASLQFETPDTIEAFKRKKS